MGLRPGRCYSTTKDRPFTRFAEKVQHRNYIGAVPGIKTRQFNMGNGLMEFNRILDLKVKCGPLGVQVRDNALESARLAINRALMTEVGKDEFFLKVRAFPHQILRENKQAQGAHADRIQKGMSHAFGKPIGRAVRMRDGQKIFSVLVMAENAEKAKDSLLAAAPRVPCELGVSISEDVSSIGTKPKKTRDMIKEEEDAKAAAVGVVAEGEAAQGAAAEGAVKGKGAEKKPAGKETGKPAEGKKPEAKKEEKKK